MRRKRRTHCKKGHLYTPESTIVDKKSGNRTCRICKYAYIAERRGKPETRKFNNDREKKRRKDPRVRERVKELNRIKLYKITTEEYQRKIQEQNGRCPICGIEFTFGDRTGSSPAIDHDHGCCSGHKSCGECVRSLLCNCCNQGLGNFKDNREALVKAVEYLKSYDKSEGMIGTAIYNEAGE